MRFAWHIATCGEHGNLGQCILVLCCQSYMAAANVSLAMTVLLTLLPTSQSTTMQHL